ncbi:MAG TPA: T9SS type A sorting domain-containing protein [Chitinophagaceae bacterium]|nr:T9SS type A sorting domain-containing protein [Chitinophagaceae bacterium]
MISKFTLSLLLTVCSLLIGKFAVATNYTNNGGSTPNYSLNAGDTLFIASGTYTGSIQNFPAGAVIIVTDIANTFQPSSFPNNAGGTIYVYGTFTYTSSLTTNSNFTIHNYGMVNLGAVTLKGSNQTWINHYGATINFSGDVLMNGDAGNNNVLLNYATINCNGNFQMNSGSSFINYKNFTGTGNFKVNGGSLRNEGKLDITGNMLVNSGTSVVENYCRMEASGGITNGSVNFKNYSYLYAENSDIINTGTITNISVNGSLPLLDGRDFTQSGTSVMTGPALLYFTGTTKMTSGTMGVPGTATDTIKMYDITRTNPAQILDVQSGTINPNVVYNAWGVPDRSRVYLIGCSVEILMEVPLAINWNNFVVDLFDNVPVLNWSAEFGSDAVFEIQRSYDGRNFSSIKDMAYNQGQSEYEYRDRLVNTQASIVYYRVKATELSGIEKYTQTRTVKFSNKPGSISTAPNPFTNNFIINYKADEKETITIRMFNVSGQQMLVKNVTVSNGNNSISITEAAQLVKGIYVIQVSKGYNIISSGKIIKQ